MLIEMIRAGAHPGSIDYVLKHKIRWDDKETWEDVRARYTTPETVGGIGENGNHENHEHND